MRNRLSRPPAASSGWVRSLHLMPSAHVRVCQVAQPTPSLLQLVGHVIKMGRRLWADASPQKSEAAASGHVRRPLVQGGLCEPRPALSRVDTQVVSLGNDNQSALVFFAMVLKLSRACAKIGRARGLHGGFDKIARRCPGARHERQLRACHNGQDNHRH